MKKYSFNKIPLFILTIVFLNSCSVQPEKIHYGEDNCHYCRMTIVDKIHGAEVVTKKGKVFKFDAIECMINYSAEVDKEEISLYLSNHYDTPEELIDATQATFLISKNISSPMGAFLTSFEDKASAEKIKSEKGGDLFTWEELLKHLRR
ncbi:copper chaperone NosL [Aquimarina sp. MAR_2010_214]|uniref:nitrous oxide reductase accessory protein NosL n=1 Tax=Aquimarina sp. MAR_2010_214 TaxID=1250026 RepID=UPI000C703699|nr:nitrous oxide reductase accessory protein NosL [Aquimarina sp. MAR_2010_214]PKV49275.1 copper chaperone NosL [Aquimarina sp. MAR_2010_214]